MTSVADGSQGALLGARPGWRLLTIGGVAPADRAAALAEERAAAAARDPDLRCGGRCSEF